jgi:hypothetical protein
MFKVVASKGVKPSEAFLMPAMPLRLRLGDRVLAFDSVADFVDWIVPAQLTRTITRGQASRLIQQVEAEACRRARAGKVVKLENIGAEDEDGQENQTHGR